MFASEYGYKINEFLKLTMHQVSKLLEAIRDRNYERDASKTELAFKANGKDIKVPRLKEIKTQELSKDKKNKIKKAMETALNRKLMENTRDGKQRLNRKN